MDSRNTHVGVCSTWWCMNCFVYRHDEPVMPPELYVLSWVAPEDRILVVPSAVASRRVDLHTSPSQKQQICHPDALGLH